ncbi:unnamed protein product [Bemisia tabaci]|uniref:Ig-like domain-containing protein n=1 Tax=Bemisia tabaci TaxID=7038 RepID=A0A9P0AEU1_BEMTA|nr:unnamed protein product [Bemisia tabaci]
MSGGQSQQLFAGNEATTLCQMSPVATGPLSLSLLSLSPILHATLLMRVVMASPEASYHWKRETEPSSIVMKGNALILNYAIAKKDGGNYICEAYNRHGNNTIKTYVNVMYKPECDIFKSEVDGKVVLYCNAHANPSEVDFTWKIKNENESISENVEKKGLQSILTLETRVENFRTYLCYVNNSVGMLTIPCEVDVSGSTAWWRALEQEKMLILLAIIISAILMVLIICVVIIIVCRRKRHSNKCPNPSSTTDKSNLNSSPSDALLSPDNDKAFYENLPFHGLQKPPNAALHHKLNSHSTLDMQRPNLPHSLTNGRQISSLKKPKSQRSLKHSSSRDESLLLPSYLNTPPPPPYHNGSIVYADLALSRHRVKSLQSIPMYHMEYTAIKFHDVGKEIDV